MTGRPLPLEDQPPLYEGPPCEATRMEWRGSTVVELACDLPADHDGRCWDEYLFEFWEAT